MTKRKKTTPKPKRPTAKGACGSTWRKNKVTDRALRYRANAKACRPSNPRICAMCGSKRNVEVGHVDGHEENTKPANLFWTCRACNVKAGAAFKKAGRGRRTRQYNPGGAKSLAQWLTAVMSMKGESNQMSIGDAVAMIRATPADKRSEFAHEIWGRRSARKSNPRPRKRNSDEVVQAAKLTSKFHGRPPRGLRKETERARYRSTLADLGKLFELHVVTPRGGGRLIKPRGNCRLQASPDGNQYYFRGGDQAVNPADFGVAPRDQVVLGEVARIVYLTRKDFDKFELIEYDHEFGEEGGTRPVLLYDNLNQRLSLAGGSYRTKRPGITN